MTRKNESVKNEHPDNLDGPRGLKGLRQLAAEPGIVGSSASGSGKIDDSSTDER
jgi:hypothetical protein